MIEEVMSFVTVLVVAIVVAGTVSALYASGLRLWSRGEELVETDAHIMWRVGGAVCFAACVAIVLFALWLMIPVFH